ncbi:cyclase [Microcoleus sp. FACHB-831]|uniref:SRPBCC family protein n=1 Tax=Microcoleus sp. FACHB-831 TaxID=2692827 RepID=UPI001683636F|nr:SRPBCC family protein [Microcoleus sp. FACHB-831]MBD1923344.1 cyclase [Microcoleus sp. FACHB-831]
MTGNISLTSMDAASDLPQSKNQFAAILQGEILVETRSHSAWGGAVTAQMYLPLGRSHVWQQLTDYPRWVQYFPDVRRSEVLNTKDGLTQGCKRLYQVADKSFLFLSLQVEVYLNVLEVSGQRIQFLLEKGTFADFTADLQLQDCSMGTLLTYTVQATPLIPVPSVFIEQAMKLELPANMRTMRRVICGNC